jgi:uncharacterized phiE125 gp8 family phage protein
MKYNDIIEVQVTAGPETEPLTLDEVKRHLNLLFDTAGSYDFDDDDTYLNALIGECRQAMEEILGIGLALKSYRAILRNECGGIEIPYGPISTIGDIKDIDGTLLVNGETYQLRGLEFKWIESPVSCYVDIQYSAGYSTVNIPKGLKRALLEEIAFRYNNRGDQTNKFAGENVGLSQGAMELASRYSRRSLVS